MGCRCSAACEPGTCACALEHSRGLAVLRQPKEDATHALTTLLECGPACSCSPACTARTTQRPAPRDALQLVPLPGKGSGVRARVPLQRGAFVAEYVGEVLTSREADTRLAEYDAAATSHALLVVRIVLPSGSSALRVNIDATRTAARWFNHSCDGGNLEAVVVVRKGQAAPAVALFAADGVAPGDELTFAYGPPNGAGGRPCLCGTRACRGFLPRERG